jgi:CubicO group peptidase (beta-lactamase class C family)
MSLNAQAVENLKKRASLDVEAGHIPSCQYALALDGEVVVQETLGQAPANARYCMYSATKSIFSSVVWQLIGEGKLEPAAPVADLWPEFAAHGKGKVTLEHVMLHTAGFPGAPLDASALTSRESRVRQIEQWTLDWEPSTQYAYHAGTVHWVQAELVERVTGLDYRVALRERVLDPLGLDRLELGVPPERQGDIQRMVAAGKPATKEEIAESLGLPELPPLLAAFFDMSNAAAAAAAAAEPKDAEVEEGAPELDAANGLLSALALEVGIPAGGGITDAASLALFYQNVLHDPKGIWDPDILRDVKTNIRNTMAEPYVGAIANRTLGFELAGEDPAPHIRAGSGFASPGAFGHGGASGQIAWADPATGLSFAYLTNGSDRNAARERRRIRELDAAATACVQAV